MCHLIPGIRYPCSCQEHIWLSQGLHTTCSSSIWGTRLNSTHLGFWVEMLGTVPTRVTQKEHHLKEKDNQIQISGLLIKAVICSLLALAWSHTSVTLGLEHFLKYRWVLTASWLPYFGGISILGFDVKFFIFLRRVDHIASGNPTAVSQLGPLPVTPEECMEIIFLC